MKHIYHKTISIILIVIFIIFSSVPVFAALETGTLFPHYKTGMGAMYFVMDDGTVALGDGINGAIPTEVEEFTVPADVTFFQEWKVVHPYAVTRISANAFSNCKNLRKVYIEGKVSADEDAFLGVPEDAVFITGNRGNVTALLDAGIHEEKVIYEPISTKYVAFGDSISAGYALPEYIEYDNLTNFDSDGDRFPTPKDSFVGLTGSYVADKFNSVVVDNQAVSGWTSKQLLDALKSGEFDAALNGADVVTVTIGSNDLLEPFMDIVKSVLIKELSGSKDLVVDSGIIYTVASGLSQSKLKIPVRVKTKFESFITSIGNISSSLNSALENNQELNIACEYFCKTVQPAILALVQEKAPGAKIYWTTFFNPYYGAKLDLKQLFPEIDGLNLSKEVLDSIETIDLGKFGREYIEKMNKAFEVNTEGYTAVDIYEVFNETGLTNVSITRDRGKDIESLKDDVLELGIDPHPNTKGHKLIYDTIMPVIDATYIPSDNVFIMNFEDVSESDWFYGAVKYVFENGWMNGTSDKTFEPDEKATRAMVATVLWRMAGRTKINDDIYFDDVEAGQWYVKAVKWAHKYEVTYGYGDGNFGVDDFITREQLVTFFYRFAQKLGMKNEEADISLYSDAKEISDYAVEAMKWAIGVGLINGKGNGELDPNEYATSAELATMLVRFSVIDK